MSGDSYVPSAGEGAWVLESDNSILASDPSPFYAYVCCCCLHDQDNHDGVITHLEPDILECEVKNDNPVCETAKETQMYRTVFWTLRKRERVG